MPGNSNAQTGPAFILGAVVAVLGGVIWHIATGGEPTGDQADIKIELPGIEADG